MKICSFFFAWFTSLVFYPILARILSASSGIFDTIIYYSDGAQKISDLQSASLPVSQLTQPEITNIVDTANLPAHISARLDGNMTARVFEPKGLTTVNDYFNVTIANIIDTPLMPLLITLCGIKNKLNAITMIKDPTNNPKIRIKVSSSNIQIYLKKMIQILHLLVNIIVFYNNLKLSVI
jgi:hypothetical protein